jgi:hypothetical protein
MREKIGYKTPYKDRKEIDDYYIELQNRFDNGLYPIELGQRFELCEGRGVIGWSKEEDEIAFRFWDEIPKKEKILAADEISKSLGKKQAFFELHEVSFGGPETYFITWTLETIISWALGKGLDYLFKSLKNDETIKNAKLLGEKNEYAVIDGKLYIKVKDIPEKDKATIEICRYPEVIYEITEDTIEELKKLMQNDDNKHYIYSRNGKKFIVGQGPAKHLSIDV